MSICADRSSDTRRAWTSQLTRLDWRTAVAEPEDSLDTAGQEGHSYGATSVNHNARAHFGNNVYAGNVFHLNQGVESRQPKLEILRDSLRFSRMGARARNVVTAAPTTCEWLFVDEEFQAWIDDEKISQHQGFLWIKGKPGSGKSTIMKKIQAWAEQHWSRQIIFSYFFNARAPDLLEKSALGLYRSLVYQLILVSQSVRSLFLDTFALKEQDGKVEQWTEIELQAFLDTIVLDQRIPPLVIVIDALDEGQGDEVQDMVIWLENYASYATQAGLTMRICFSSRHYPHLEISQGLSIVLENEPGHEQDISTYIQKTLRGNHGLPMQKLRCTILSRSQGIFLWVVLVIPMLNRIYNQGKGSSAMVQLLEGVPQGLHELFGTILSRNEEDFSEFVTLFQWVLYSFDPLRPTHLYTAIQQRHPSVLLDTEVMEDKDLQERYLLNCSRGLVEISHTFVQFIHQSVRDFLTGKDTRVSFPAIFDQEVQTSSFQATACHATIAKGCLHYLGHLSNKAPLTFSLLQKYQLAQYAAKYWWQHMKALGDACDQELIDLASNLLLDPTSLLIWVQIHNVDVPREKASVTIPRTALASPLYYAAKIGLPQLVSSMLRQEPPNFGTTAGIVENLQSRAVTGATHCGRTRRAQLRRTLIANETHFALVDAIQAAAEHGHETIVDILLKAGAKPNLVWAGIAAATLSEQTSLKICKVLLDNTDVANTPDAPRVLSRAVVQGQLNMVQTLIEAGVNVNTLTRDGELPLVQASLQGNERMVQIILNAGADVNLRGNKGQIALVEAAHVGHTAIVAMLLEVRSNVNAVDTSRGGTTTALVEASKKGHLSVLKLLLEAGADIFPAHSDDDALTVALQGQADMENLSKILRLLFDNAQSHPKRKEIMESALITAIQCDRANRSELTRLLLIQGADVHTQTDSGSHMWMEAARKGDAQTLQILIRAGASIDLTEQASQDVLNTASKNRLENVVLLLLRHAEALPEEEDFYTDLLSAALRLGWEETTQLLLDREASVNAQLADEHDISTIVSDEPYTELVNILLDLGH